MYKDMIKGWAKHIDFMLLDILCLELSFLIAYVLRQGDLPGELPTLYRYAMGMIFVLDICAVLFCNSYSEIIQRGYLVELKQVLVHCAFVVIGMIIWFFLIKQSSEYSRLIIIGMYPISVCVLTVERLGWKRIIRMQRKSRKDLRKILIVTTKNNAKKIVGGLLQPYRNFKLEAVAFYDQEEHTDEKIYSVPVVADKNTLLPYIKNHVIDEVFIDLETDEERENLSNQLVNMGVVVHMKLVENIPEKSNRKVETLGRYTVLSSGMKIAAFYQIFIKRVMDICGALVGLFLTGIAAVIFGPVIYYQSPGPIFFSQERVSRNGRTFRIYKFRTMYLDAEERKKELMEQNKMKGLMFKMDDDPRIIPIGHFLRRTSIDELPQFWNILKGEMSMVGTRPPTVEEYQQYEMFHRKRLAMKPGLTGMWQISGRSNIVDFDEVVTLDAQYIENWNISMDIKILWKTVQIVLRGEGAV